MEPRRYGARKCVGLYVCLVTELAERIFTASQSWGDNWIELQRFRTSNQINGIINHLKGQVEERNPFEKWRGNFIHCANAVIHLADDGTIEKRPFSHLDRSRNASPIKYDPTASCPRFRSMLLGHLKADDCEVLQKLAGQALLGRNVTQRFAILDGATASSLGSSGAIAGVVGDGLHGLIPRSLLIG